MKFGQAPDWCGGIVLLYTLIHYTDNQLHKCNDWCGYVICK